MSTTSFNYGVFSLIYVCQNHCNNGAAGLRLLADQTRKNRLRTGSPLDKNKSVKEEETLPMANLPKAVLD